MRKLVGWCALGGLLALSSAGFASAQTDAPALDANNGAPAEVPAKPTAIPRVFYTGLGQFEVVVLDDEDAQSALEVGRAVWEGLRNVLGLPAEGYPQPVTIRLVPEAQWTEPAVFRVVIEPPGRVSAFVRWSKDVDMLNVRRAFVQALILRQAAAWHGVNPNLIVPLWLEHACSNLSLARERPSMLDQFQQESSASRAVPPLRALLTWERGVVESRDRELASLWLLLQLQAEAGGDWPRWGGWLRGVVGGADPMMTLPQAYQGLWSSLADMELWWQVGFHQQRRARTLPVLSAESSRAWLADRSRWLATRGGFETVLSLSALYDLRKEPWVRAELGERSTQALGIIATVHPFYANTVLSMGRMYEAALKGNRKKFEAAKAEFERDAFDARELEDTVNAILDTAPRS